MSENFRQSTINFVGGPWILRPMDETLTTNAVCDKKNARNVSLFFNSWIALLSDSPSSVSQYAVTKKVVWRFYKEITTRPLGDTLEKYAALAHALMALPTLYGQGSITGEFITAFKQTPIFVVYLRWFQTGNPELYDYVLNFCLFGKNIPYESKSLDSVAFRDWSKTEDRLSSFSLPVKHIGNVKRIVKFLLDVDVDEIPFMGHNGPGSTSERIRDVFGKLPLLQSHPKLERGFFSNVSRRRRKEIGHTPRSLPDHDVWTSGTCASAARLMFVPKTYKTSRSICMEPVSFMYFQQSYRWELEERISRSRLSRHVDLAHQSKNQRGALLGSYTGNLDTIDLRAASDSVHKDIVKAIFPAEIAFKLFSTRTSKVIHDGREIKVNKFAPMGSALCFPVQCIIFAALTHYAYLLQQRDYNVGSDDVNIDTLRIRFGHYAHNRYEPYIVYGDDIVCDSRVTRILYHLLNEFGFIVNEEKSFTGSQAFRESCGMYYYNGHDVTPVKYRVKTHDVKLGYRELESLISVINRLGDKGYVNTRSFLIQRIQFFYTYQSGKRKKNRTRGLSVLFSDNEEKSLAIYTTNPVNTHLRKREWDPDVVTTDESHSAQRYQTEEYYCLRPVRSRRIHCDENHKYLYEKYALGEWLRASYSHGGRDAITTHPHDCSQYMDLRLAGRWTTRY